MGQGPRKAAVAELEEAQREAAAEGSLAWGAEKWAGLLPLPAPFAMEGGGQDRLQFASGGRGYTEDCSGPE